LHQHQHTSRIIRCDLGTENTTIEVLQPFSVTTATIHLLGVKSFMYGKSTANQGIKAWWALLESTPWVGG